MTNITKIVAQNVKKRRLDLKLTQQQLADEIGISRSYLSDFENSNKNISIVTLEKLANKLDVPIITLLSEVRE